MIGASDVASTPRPGAHARRGFDHCSDHLRVLTHSQVIIGAPDDHVARPMRGVPDRAREAAGKPLQIGEDSIAALIPEPGEGIGKIGVVIHSLLPPAKRGLFWNAPKLFFRGVPGPLSRR